MRLNVEERQANELKRLYIGKLEVGPVPLVVGTVTREETLHTLGRAARSDFDLIEIRLDEMDDAPERVFEWCGKTKIPTLLTIRSLKEGGKWRGREKDRCALYQAAMPYVAAIDVEIESGSLKKLAAVAHRFRKTVVGSYHDFDGTPSIRALRTVVQCGREQGAHIVKIATMIKNPADLVPHFELVSTEKRTPLCLIGMGPLGTHTRVSLACMGSCLTYGYIDRPAAPGQFSCKKLRSLLNEFLRGRK